MKVGAISSNRNIPLLEEDDFLDSNRS
jgi:ribose 1,5-bisphosphokinase PhnN